MGCNSSVAVAFDKIQHSPQWLEWSEKFDALQLSSKEVRQFHKVFFKADLDGGGTIGLVELLTIIDVERTPFTKRVFSIFDDDSSGEIDFGEFVLSLWNYCTLSKVALAMFAFDIYDTDSSGVLEDYDLETMVKDIYGKHAATSHYARALLKDLADLAKQHGDINLDIFLEFSRTHHSLLWPAFQMQLYLKKKFLGIRFWAIHSERRVKISKNKYVSIKDLLILNMKDKLNELDPKTLIPKTQMALEHVGTKADRRRKSIAEPSEEEKASAKQRAKSKEFKAQEFMNAYLRDYNVQQHNSNKYDSIKRVGSNDSSDKTETMSSSGESSVKNATRRKSFESQRGVDVMKPVIEASLSREKLFDPDDIGDTEDLQIIVPKKSMKPGSSFLVPTNEQENKEHYTAVRRKSYAGRSTNAAVAAGLDADVLQHLQENYPGLVGYKEIPERDRISSNAPAPRPALNLTLADVRSGSNKQHNSSNLSLKSAATAVIGVSPLSNKATPSTQASASSTHSMKSLAAGASNQPTPNGKIATAGASLVTPNGGKTGFASFLAEGGSDNVGTSRKAGRRGSVM